MNKTIIPYGKQNITKEDRFKITFNFGDLGQMVWLTDNEGEEPLYEYGSGVFPRNAMDIPDVPLEPVTDPTEIKAPTKEEFVKWFNNKFEEIGMKLGFIQPNLKKYEQNSREFVIGLSILDVLFCKPIFSINKNGLLTL